MESYLDDRVRLYRAYFPAAAAAATFAALQAETRWLQRGYPDHAGGVTKLPRLTANYGERSYDYARMTFEPEPWTSRLRELKVAAEREAGVPFNAAILQLYRDGKDSVNWHADDSPLVGENPVIVSLSFGGERVFQLKRKADVTDRTELRLASGDLLVMRGDLQHHYLHKVPKQADAAARINITFRRIVDPPA